MCAFENLISKINKLASPGIVPGLARMSRMMDLLDHPENAFKTIHIAGSNGKGSVASTLNAVLLESGYHTALYTSPHLVSFGERLTITGEPVSAEEWEEKFDLLVKTIEKDSLLSEDMPTFFELTTAVAFMLIREKKVDVAIIETGLGGRLDATNVMDNVELSVITSICMDHMEFLGDTIIKIADEKFAIAHEEKPVVYLPDSVELSDEFKKVMAERKAIAISADEISSAELLDIDLTGTAISFIYKNNKYVFKTALIGIHQVKNLQLSLTALMTLKEKYNAISAETIRNALLKLRWPCRFELVSDNPVVIFDGAHNPQAMKMLSLTLQQINLNKKIRIVLAMMHDKDIANSLNYMAALSPDVYCTEVPNMPRCASADELKGFIENAGMKVSGIYKEPWDAIRAAVNEEVITVVCGSLYLLGYIKSKTDFSAMKNGIEKNG